MEDYDPKEFLLFALRHFDLELTSQNGNMFFLAGDYAIELEGRQLFKLLQGGQVVAPFSDVAELCNFIKMDRQING